MPRDFILSAVLHGSERPFDALPLTFRVALALRRAPVWAHWALATLLVVNFSLLRDVTVFSEDRYPFLFFFPAILIAGTFLRSGSGLLAVALSSILVWITFTLPTGISWLDGQHLFSMAVFIGSGTVIAFIGGGYQRSFFALAKAHEAAAAARDSKQLLLEELAHRFKNDLANLTALFQMRARASTDASTRRELMAASDQVDILGRLHRRLDMSSGDVQIDLRTFLMDLCDDLRVTAIDVRPIQFHATIAPVTSTVSTAVTIGLVVNELVRNAVKYAFPDGASGNILLKLLQDGEELCLCVEDDGIGDAGAISGTGLGQRLIRAFAMKLGGTYTVEIGNGRRAAIRFPIQPQKTVTIINHR